VSIWTRINPNDRDTWPRPGNLVLVSNDYGAAFNLRSLPIWELFCHYSAPSYQCQKRANTGEFGRKRLRLSQPCRTYVPMQPNNDEPTATTEPPDVNMTLALHKRWLHDKEGGESANLSSADLSSANLRYANLRYANLRSADLSSANLRSADLSYANLRSANLSSADLRSADLSYADLRSANLRSADLSYANLRSADLRSANLRSADLSSADLRSADLRSADLRSADLSSADLESARLPDGVRWWQGGAYGPRRRMLRVWRINTDIYAQAGCIHGSPDDVLAAIQYRRDDWATELGADAAQTELDRFAVLMAVALDQLG